MRLGRIAIYLEGDYSQHTEILPESCEVFGVIEILKTGAKGALVRLSSGQWQMIEGGRYTDLPEKKVRAALTESQANQGSSP